MGLNEGFNVTFLGENYPIPFPQLKDDIGRLAVEGGKVFPFTHFSIVMNKDRKFAIYGANNTNAEQDLRIDRCNDWHFDDRIGEENQVGDWLYAGGQADLWDRGHLVRRDDVGWGEDAEGNDADCDSFCYANIVPQHKKFHATKWGDIEKWIIGRTESKDNKLSIFTGPIYTDNDREYCGFQKPLGCGIKIPAGFWKVAFYIGTDEKLHSTAFKILQDDYWRNESAFHTSSSFGFLNGMENLTMYQVSLTAITEVTGIKFAEHLYETNPLFFNPNTFTERLSIATPEMHVIRSQTDLILDRSL
ncbi:DNA/RNA non-specific endonuclease [Paenibacillus barcinonensis]|uniref:DNA/RNA non-specific endonuclease n=1 Tax=Paenibacillus barcinonensis TaxID=198119 RepID=UPI001C1034EA|nr:DNA/RNA non-specific endonuclease [Paenibacillus barcinonensis]MBU5351951.1 DNA/RNA non-specific endonuclease [Paenibacillus barcinonensis]